MLDSSTNQSEACRKFAWKSNPYIHTITGDSIALHNHFTINCTVALVGRVIRGLVELIDNAPLYGRWKYAQTTMFVCSNEQWPQ